MNNLLILNIVRFFLFLGLQVLVLQQMIFGPILGEYLRGFIYPLFLLLLPFRTSVEILMLVGFAMGIAVDTMYGTFGVHASASVGLMAFRGTILNQIQPKGKYNLNKGLTPANYPLNWFLSYLGISYALFTLWLSILEVFQIWRVGTILLRALFMFPISIFFIFI
ncbi:MAG: hypothetical protein AAF242_06865, partial [Bacteroidota bacterium]